MLFFGNKHLDRAEQILNFWFGKMDDPDYGRPKDFWFNSDPIIEKQIKQLFLADHRRASRNQLNHWEQDPVTCLALIVILDQFSRIIYRNHALSFACDTAALEIAKRALEKDFDQNLMPTQRWFMYLPFKHSENMADQMRSIELFGDLANDPDSQEIIQSAMKHSMIIQYFGRFPARNNILKRESSAMEIQFKELHDSRI